MGTRERREREKQQRRDDILAAARSLFLRRGYERTTMPQIAKATELAPGTLYLYFPSKQALYVELLDEGYDLLFDRLSTAADPGATPRRQAATLIDAFFAFARDYPAYFDIIFFVVQREGHAVRELTLEARQAERLDERQQACMHVAADVLKRAGLPRRRAARAIEAVWSMLAGVVLYFVHDEPDTFKAVTTEAKRLILKAIFGS